MITPARPNSGTAMLDGMPVPFLFWPVAIATLGAWAAGMPLDGEGVLMAAALLMLAGGLPHGAYDLALAGRIFGLGRKRALLTLGGYLGIAGLMLGLWMSAPVAALVVFLAIAAFHFGEDWTVLSSGLLRTMAGASIICTPALGQPAEVEYLFLLLTGTTESIWVAKVAIAAAPMALLVTAIGLLETWRQGCRRWVIAYGAALLALLVAPPELAFMLYFVLLHSPRHLYHLRQTFSDWPLSRMIAYGAVVSIMAVALLPIWSTADLLQSAARFGAESFRLLSVVAAPHLALSILIERQISRGRAPEPDLLLEAGTPSFLVSGPRMD